jgi:NitT/TauT family transport system substrate-binding protein
MRKNTIRKWIPVATCFILLLLLWECAVCYFTHLLFILPRPSEIFKTLWEMRTRFWFHTFVTFKEMFAGFLLALFFAFPLAWTMMRYKTTRSLFQPLFIIIQCIPMFTLAPIMVVWFGWGYIAIIIPTALMIFFPLTLNIYQGLRSTPEDLLEFFQANQATSLQTFFKLRLPWALPQIFSGFRIAAAIAGVSAVAGEWAGAQEGLGILMLESRRNTDLEITFGALFCLTVMSILLYLLILACEKMALAFCRGKRSFTKLMGFFLLSLFLCSALVGCHPKKERGTETRLLLDWLPNPNHVPLYVGVDLGYFHEAGIDLTIQKMHEGGGGIAYLVAQKTDLLVNHMPGTLKACERGAKLKMIGCLIKEPLCGLIYKEDPAIQKPSDLSGKIFGYCIGVPDIDFLHFLLSSGNIYPKMKKNVSVDLVASLGTGKVDFIYGGFWNIEPAQLHSLGIETKTFKIQDLGVPFYYEMIILANSGTLFSTPTFVDHFQRALQKSITYCKEHPDLAFAIYLKYNLDRREKTNEWQKEAWALTIPLLCNDQTIDTQIIKEFYEWQVKEGIIVNPFDFQELTNIK